MVLTPHGDRALLRLKTGHWEVRVQALHLDLDVGVREGARDRGGRHGLPGVSVPVALLLEVGLPWDGHKGFRSCNTRAL